MIFDIRLSDSASEDLEDLSVAIAKRITKKLKEIRASSDPMNYAKALTGDLKGLFRFRIGNYRAVFRKESDGTITIILILRVKHRKEIYD